MSNKKVWLRISKGQLEGLYQVKPFIAEFHADELPHCPCCDGALLAAFDVCQWGFFDDRYRTYAVCKACGKAYTLDYSVPTYELVSKKAQRAAGLLSTSKKIPERSEGKALPCKRHKWEKLAYGETYARRCVKCGATEGRK